MSPPPEEMISWVLEELVLSGAEGIPISKLFDSVNAHLSSTSIAPIDAATKDNLWKSFVSRQDVQILDEEAASLQSLAYENVLDRLLGETKVIIRVPVQSSAPNGNLAQHQVQADQSSTSAVTLTQAAQPSEALLLPSIEPQTPSSAARASLEPRPSTRHSERLSVQRTESPTATLTPQKKGPIRKTSRRWVEKAHHVTQEEVEKEEDVRQYAAGLARVYIDPPGSARPAVSESSQLPDVPSRKRGRPPKVKEKIAVFKSLCLTDPLWLVKKRGSWKEAYNQRKMELENLQSIEQSTVLKGSKPRRSSENLMVSLDPVPLSPQTRQPAEKSVLPPEPVSNEPDSEANPPIDTIQVEPATSAIASSSMKRKAQNIADINSNSGNGQRPKKRGRPRKVVAPTAESQSAAVEAPIPPVHTPSSHGAIAVQPAVPQQPIIQQIAITPRIELLARSMQTKPTTYKSPYSSFDGRGATNPTQALRNPDPMSSRHSFSNTASENQTIPPLTQSDTPEQTIRPPLTHDRQSQLPLQVEMPITSSHLHHYPNQGYMNSHYMTGPIIPSHQGQQNSYAYPPSVPGVQANFGFDTATLHASDIPANLYPPPQHNAFSNRNGHPQPPQQPMPLQPQPQGPPLGSFSGLPPQPNFSTPIASAQSASVLNNDQKRTEERGSALLGTVKSTQSPVSSVVARTERDPQYKPKLLADLEAMEATLSRCSAQAEAIEIPDVAARLFVSHDDVVGNLLLSGDKTQLTFWSLEQEFWEDPQLVVQVTQLSENPIVSMKGSRPMELRLKYKDEADNEIVCRFYVGQSETAYQAANVMRASIVTARIICRAANGETNPHELFKESAVPNIDVVKPFKCDTCTKRFKNREGIKYHREKSNTTCNPNFVPPIDPPKPKRVLKRKSQPKAAAAKPPRKKAKKVDFVEEENSEDQEDIILQSVEDESSSNSVHDSDDSVFEWAEKVAFVNPGETVRSAPPTPKKSTPKKSKSKAKPLTLEEGILQELVAEAINDTPVDETTDTIVENVLREIVDETVNFTVLQEQFSDSPNVADTQIDGSDAGLASLDQVNNQRSMDIILNLVNRNFGIFPGEQGLWFSFVAIWLQNHARSDGLPTSKLCDNAVDQLIREQKLMSTTFPIHGEDSMASTRTIITTTTTELGSPPFETLKELIRLAYPGHYVPSRFAPPIEVREKLERFLEGSFPSTRRRRNDSKPDVVSRDDSDYQSGFEDEASIRSDNIEDIEEVDSDDSYYGETSHKNKHGQKQAQRMKSYWAASKAAGNNALTKTGDYGPFDIESSLETTPEGDLNRGRSLFGRPKAKPRAWKGGPIPVQEKERRKIITANKMLNFAQTTLQNAVTGAWNQAPLRPERPRTKLFKYRLPEVVTYLQSENGAWATRAFGHGSTPIFPRLQRRADGNPHLQSYIKRIEAGHRPIVKPNPKNRQYLPAVPSKILLGTGKPKQPRKKRTSNRLSGDESRPKHKRSVSILSLGDSEVPRPKRKYTRRKASMVSNSEDEDDQPTPAQDQEDEDIQPTPKRRRTIFFKTKRQLSIEDDADSDFYARVVPQNVAPRLTRKAARGGHNLDEIQMLGFFHPRAFSDFQKSPNSGLVTLPTSFWVGDTAVLVGGGGLKPPAIHNTTPGLIGIEKVAGWEQGPGQGMLARRSKAAGYLWVNHTVDAMENSFDTELMKLKWEPSTAFKIEDLPYTELDGLEDAETVDAPAPTKSQKSPLKKRKRWSPKRLCTRRLTAWPTDFDGVLENIDSVREDLGVELAPRLNPGHGRALDGTMTGQEETRLLVAVVVVTVLTGGVKETPNWVLVANNFPKYSPNYIEKAWRRMLKNEKTTIQTLTSDFQEAYISAYETGTVPEIDYDNLVDYNWPKVIDWAVNTVYRKARNGNTTLPNTRKEMKKMWDMQEQDSGADKTREMYFDPKAATYKRMESVTALARTRPADAVPAPRNADDIEIDEVTLARSWIKALVLTPPVDYDVEVARDKLVQLGEDLVAEVREALISEKVIMPANKGRAVPGRMFEPTDAFFSTLRKHGSDEHFVEAMKFKKYLDDEFASGTQCVRHDYLANEGTIMCVTNLQAHGRIKLKGVNVPMNKMGLTGGGYETRKMPKQTFRFEMDIYPTDSYLYNEDIPPLQIVEFLEPPRGGNAGEIPIWYGVTDTLIPLVWKKVLVAVTSIASLRSGASVASLETTFRPALEEWEIWRLMEWGVNVGLVKKIDESCEGWTMGEWWWAVVGKFCDTTDEE